MACNVAQKLEDAHRQSSGNDERVRREELHDRTVESMQIRDGGLGEVSSPRGSHGKHCKEADAKTRVQKKLKLCQSDWV